MSESIWPYWPGYTYMRDCLRKDGLPVDKLDFVDGWVLMPAPRAIVGHWEDGKVIIDDMGALPVPIWKPRNTAELVDVLRCAVALVDESYSLPQRFTQAAEPIFVSSLQLTNELGTGYTYQPDGHINE